ncbi:MAG: ABC transporter ATP-binding protein [Candidatus Heimdallarchaeum endolithica]|uniref:ABC transporter ATP-binding protein n=1 Tax=Candidatus Heimdallarchaeum endolithica TaxID=2876572 RepID=A0A9Y1FQD6_9ARCH|nr:MAG: ABC transporter ATP-binding protein [Candidatus Heimdallarchaeum endolithica]
MVKKLIVENLEKVYRSEVETIAIRDFNLEIKEGESIVLAGPSGSGKTTILLCIAAMLKPTFGKIIYENKIVNKLSREELIEYRCNKVGMMFQSFNLIEYMTVFENVAFPMWIAGKKKKEIKERVNYLLEELEIRKYEKTYPRFLSGGEQQRVALAVALANNPNIVLADEPTGNLDRKNSDKVIKLLKKETVEKNKILILATHDEKIIAKAEKVISLKKRM